jgi:hypothetical protein
MPAAAAARGRVTAFTLACNYLPLVQLALGALVVSSLLRTPAARALGALAWLYLLPPLAGRLTALAFGAAQGRGLTQDTRAYKAWWLTQQWQVVFNRLPLLEEALRLVPGLYAAWLRLWGGRVSPWAYWAAGAVVVDRQLVVVEAGAVIGMGAGLTGHLARLAPDGTFVVDVGAPRVERGAIMGARSGLGPGAELAAHHVLPAGKMIPPFVRWEGGGRRPLGPSGGGDD